MKTKLLLGTTIVLSCFLLVSSTPQDLPTVENEAFQVGEKLRYRITYGFMDAGEAILELKNTQKKGNGRVDSCYRDW
jgi:hypothetical protein